METLNTLVVKSPVGELTLFAADDRIVALEFGRGEDAPRKTTSPVLNAAQAQLAKYFEAGTTAFDLALDAVGTPFQMRVWGALQKIKPGTVKTYGEIAKSLKSSPRAVGTACGANPLPILIPCHRVLKTGGGLGGYSGGNGLETKAFLLRLEGYKDF